MKTMLYIYLVMQGPIYSKDLVLGTHYMRYSPPPLGAFCIVEERISPRGIQLNLGLTEEASFSMDLP